MFTDMVGYTSLMQRNEPLALTLLEEHRRMVREILPRHGGTEIKTIGDAFMVEFLSALEALLCAVDIQKAFEEENLARPNGQGIRLRIGIHVGDVEHRGGDIYGDAVNIASRIEPLAAPGRIVITQQVFDQIRNKVGFGFERLGPKSLKNVELPVEVYMVVQKGGAGVFEVPVDERKRIVVLPFANMSPDRGDDYFSDGMTEELISALSKIGQLGVISRTSAMKYKEASKSVREIGAELQVDNLLEGSVRKAGNRVRVTVQLIEVAEDRHVWAETYDRDFEDVFALQSDIAQKVAGSLKVQLLPREVKRMSTGAPSNAKAYDLYLQGRYHWNRRTKESLFKAIELFGKAAKLDPNYALAYVGTADSYTVLADHLYLPSEEASSKAKEAALKAIELDDDLAEAHVSLGGILGLFEWNQPAAEREFKKAIELNPNYATAHQWYSLALCYLGRLEEASAEAMQALRLDPLSPIIYTDLGDITNDMGAHEAATGMLKKALELDHDFIPALLGLANAYALMGSYSESEGAARKLVSLDAGPIGELVLAYSFAVSGRREESRGLLERLLPAVERSYDDAADVAAVFLALGDREKALEWLEKGFKARASGLMAIGSDNRFAALRSDPRFVSILRRMGIRPA